MPLQQAFITQVGLAKETTWGTGVAPSVADQFLPINAPKPADKFTSLYDRALRGLGAFDYGYYQGVGKSEWDFDTYVYPDVIGNPIMASLGVDTITGAGPYTHTFTLAAARPPSYSISDYDGLTSGGQSRRYVGAYLETLNFKWASNADFKATCKFHGETSTAVAKPSATYTTQNLLRAWEANLTLAGGSDTKLSDFDCTMKRTIDLVYGSGNSQNPIDIVPGPLEVSGKATFASFDETHLNYYLNNTQPTFSTNFTDGTNQLTLQMTKCAFEDPTVVDRTKTYAFVTATWRAIYNTTDSGPMKIILINGKSVAY